MFSSVAGHEALVGQLLAARIDVNIRNKYGTTPLATAAYVGNRGVVEQLLAVPGIDNKAANYEGVKPLSIAQSRGYKCIVDVGKKSNREG